MCSKAGGRSHRTKNQRPCRDKMASEWIIVAFRSAKGTPFAESLCRNPIRKRKRRILVAITQANRTRNRRLRFRLGLFHILGAKGDDKRMAQTSCHREVLHVSRLIKLHGEPARHPEMRHESIAVV